MWSLVRKGLWESWKLQVRGYRGEGICIEIWIESYATERYLLLWTRKAKGALRTRPQSQKAHLVGTHLKCEDCIWKGGAWTENCAEGALPLNSPPAPAQQCFPRLVPEGQWSCSCRGPGFRLSLQQSLATVFTWHWFYSMQDLVGSWPGSLIPESCWGQEMGARATGPGCRMLQAWNRVSPNEGMCASGDLTR